MHTKLSKLKISQLNQIALLCGLQIPTPSNKISRIEAIVSGLALATLIPQQHTSILAIDVGIKNLSYCLANYENLLGPPLGSVERWSKIDLHTNYGHRYTPLIAANSAIDNRRYLNHLCVSLADDLVGKTKNARSRPNIVVMEIQRTRSNNNAITLPNVLMNFTFESILYSNLTNRGLIVVPMHSTSMASFWINRFLTKSSLTRKSSLSKSLRSVLFFEGILKNEDMVSIPSVQIDHDLSLQKKSNQLLSSLEIDPTSTKKVDDLIDSILYNLTVAYQLHNQHTLIRYLKNGEDLDKFITNGNLRQLSLVKPLIDHFDLQLNDDFVPYLASL